MSRHFERFPVLNPHQGTSLIKVHAIVYYKHEMNCLIIPNVREVDMTVKKTQNVTTWINYNGMNFDALIFYESTEASIEFDTFTLGDL